MTKRESIPPFYRPVWYDYREEEQRHARAVQNAPSFYKAQAVFQGLVALGFLALGRHSLSHNWPIGFLIAFGSLQKAVENHTKALSSYLSLRKKGKQI